MDGGWFNLLECGNEDGESEERAEHGVGEEEEEGGGEQDSQLDQQAGRWWRSGTPFGVQVHPCTVLYIRLVLSLNLATPPPNEWEGAVQSIQDHSLSLFYSSLSSSDSDSW